jgi:hypothetical protein
MVERKPSAPTIATPSNALIALDAKPHYVTEIFVADAARHWHELDVAICFACIEENVVQIDPVNDNVRVFKPLHERCAGRDPRDYPTINRIKHKQRVGNNRLLQYRFADAQAIKNPYGPKQVQRRRPPNPPPTTRIGSRAVVAIPNKAGLPAVTVNNRTFIIQNRNATKSL